MAKTPPVVTVHAVEEAVTLAPESEVKIAPESIEAIAGAAGPKRAGRATDPAAAKAADDQVRVSTIETISTPHSQEEESLVAEGQRNINLIWEGTQKIVSHYGIGSAIVAALYLIIFSDSETLRIAAFTFLVGLANNIAGHYFGRTNHQRIGGVQQGR